MPAMDIAALERFLDETFPQSRVVGFRIAALDDERLVLSLRTTNAHLRPGGTVSGPTLMALADSAAYLLILARLGPGRSCSSSRVPSRGELRTHASWSPSNRLEINWN